jgi:hypothetical protein
MEALGLQTLIWGQRFGQPLHRRIWLVERSSPEVNLIA